MGSRGSLNVRFQLRQKDHDPVNNTTTALLTWRDLPRPRDSRTNYNRFVAQAEDSEYVIRAEMNQTRGVYEFVVLRGRNGAPNTRRRINDFHEVKSATEAMALAQMARRP